MSKNGITGSPRPDNHVIVLFGATGDLAKRKLLPGLFHLHAAGLLPREYRVVGTSPPSFALTEEQFRAHAKEACASFCITKPDDPSWPEFEDRLSFATAEPGDTMELEAALQRAEKEIGGSPQRLYHLAVPPAAFTSVVGMLGAAGLAKDARVIVEKPFGTDLASARVLNQAVHAVFDESQVFRIDHFLGKESVDNILAFRALRPWVVGPGVGRAADRAVPVAPARQLGALADGRHRGLWRDATCRCRRARRSRRAGQREWPSTSSPRTCGSGAFWPNDTGFR